VRTPFVDVPTATYTPTDTVAHTTEFSGLCFLYGYDTPFSDSTLDSLYRNHLEYFGKLLFESGALVAQGFWLAPDARQQCKKHSMPMSVAVAVEPPGRMRDLPRVLPLTKGRWAGELQFSAIARGESC